MLYEVITEPHLIVAESPLRRRLLTALALLVLAALCSLVRSGYAAWAGLLTPPRNNFV